MTAEISAYGRLGGDPVERQTSTSKTMTTATLAVDAGRNTDDPPLWVKLVAFGQAAETLARHHKGDLLAVVGRLQVNRWTDRNDTAREDLQVVADQIVSARTTRPGGGKKREAKPATPSAGHPLLDDPIPFAPETRA